jgi:hypothetical protein
MIKRAGALSGVLLLIFLQACEAPRTDLEAGKTADHEVARIQPARTTPAPSRSTNPGALPAEPLFSNEDRDPRRLLEMSRQNLANLLGKPQFVRREARARVWQYRTEACVLDLFLYDVASRYEVIHYEFRAARGLAGPTSGCFEKLLTRAATLAKS